MRTGAKSPKTMANIDVTKSLAKMRGSSEGDEIVLMRNKAPNTTATALRAYTSGLVLIRGAEIGVFNY